MKYIIISVVFLALVCISACNNNLQFEKIEHESWIRNSQKDSTLHILDESFIVSGYYDSEKGEKAIDDFVCRYMRELNDEYYLIQLAFYESSRKTNIDYLEKHPNYLSESLLNDYLWNYSFDGQSKFIRKFKVKNFKNRKFYFDKPECLVEPSLK